MLVDFLESVVVRPIAQSWTGHAANRNTLDIVLGLGSLCFIFNQSFIGLNRNRCRMRRR